MGLFRKIIKSNYIPTQEELDAETLKQLELHGANLSKRREVIYSIVVPVGTDLRLITENLEGGNWTVEVEPIDERDSGDQYISLHVHETMNMSVATARRQELEALLTNIPGSIYDGWVAAAEDDE